MTDTFLEYEASQEDSEPIELFAIVTSTGQAYYLTSAIRDISYGFRTYKATAIDHNEVAQDSNTDARDLEISIAIDHPLVRRWATYGVPPKRTNVLVTRLQHGVAEEWWEGDVTSLAWEKSIAKLRVPCRMSDALQRKIPNVTCSKTCTHILYDRGCGISETGTTPGGLSHQVAATATAVNGWYVKVDLLSTDRNGSWAVGGTLEHTATGEKMTIAKQIDSAPGTSGVAVLQLQARLVEIRVGDAVRIQRGCRHTITACRDDFDNVDKFSGYPDVPHFNPFKYGRFPDAG